MSTCQQKKSLRTRYFGKRKCIFQKVLEDGTNSCLSESITDYIQIVFMYWNICTIHFMDSGFNLDNDKSTCVIRSFSSLLRSSICLTIWFNTTPRGLRGRDRSIVGFITAYTISAHHH